MKISDLLDPEKMKDLDDTFKPFLEREITDQCEHVFDRIDKRTQQCKFCKAMKVCLQK